MKNKIHPSAVISPGAQVGERNQIGPFVVIENNVIIGDGNRLSAHCVLKSGSRIGNGNEIHEHAVIGGTPQDLKFNEVTSYAVIGNQNVLREGVTVHRGSRENSRTVIGNDNFLMAYAHVAHDCTLADKIVIANNVALAGEVEVESQVFISGGVVVHQFTRLGRLAMIGGNSKITQDVLPFFITDGVPGQVRGLNMVGLTRAGFQPAEIGDLKHAYRILLRSRLLLQAAIEELKRIDSPHVTHLREFAASSKRGFHR